MITADQVTALTAQAATAADIYDAYDDNGTLLPGWQLNIDEIPVYLGSEIATRGIGVYGQTVAGLTVAGLLKPGVEGLITGPSMVITVLNNPAVWTGQQGINSLVAYLDDTTVQNFAQQEIMRGAFQGLLDAEILVGNETARYQATFLQPATRYGVDAVISWIQGTASNDLVNKLKIAARQGQYAIDFVEAYSNAINSAVDVPGFINTVDRADLDQSLIDIVGNEKVPTIDYADLIAVEIVPESNEDSRFRFAPGSQNG
jgi:hypothetical protein